MDTFDDLKELDERIKLLTAMYRDLLDRVNQHHEHHPAGGATIPTTVIIWIFGAFLAIVGASFAYTAHTYSDAAATIKDVQSEHRRITERLITDETNWSNWLKSWQDDEAQWREALKRAK